MVTQGAAASAERMADSSVKVWGRRRPSQTSRTDRVAEGPGIDRDAERIAVRWCQRERDRVGGGRHVGDGDGLTHAVAERE